MMRCVTIEMCRDGFGLKANLACRLRIMWISSIPERIMSAVFSDLNAQSIPRGGRSPSIRMSI